MRASMLSASPVILFSLIWFSIATLQAEATIAVVNGVSRKIDSIITRDITIIGGGSTGTYAAIRLSDLGYSVAVVEKKNRLGGHTETYTDPGTGNTIDYGVVIWHNLTIVRDYFKRLNVSLINSPNGDGVTVYADFRTGVVDSAYTPPSFVAALGKYTEQLLKYPYVENGFDLPYPVPSDLLLPFGKFVTKYALEDMVGFLFGFAQGLGNLLEQPTLYVFKNFGADLINQLSIGFVTTELNNNSLLYEHAGDELGDNALLESNILAVDRSDSGVKIVVQTPSGVVLIKSKKLIFTIPPKLDNLRGWDLSHSEKKLFKQFGNSAYYTGILRNTGLPANVSSISNIGVDTLYNLPTLPGIYSLYQTSTPGLMSVKFGGAHEIPDTEVQQSILASIRKLQVPGKVESEPELAVYSSHAPFELKVPPRAIAAGFYRDLYGLQGMMSTYYTGAAFHTHDSTLLWQFTETMLPNITAELATVSG